MFPFNWKEKRHDKLPTALAVPCILGSVPPAIIYIISALNPDKDYWDLLATILDWSACCLTIVIWVCMLIGFHTDKDARILEKIIFFILIIGCGIVVVFPFLLASVLQTIYLIGGLFGW